MAIILLERPGALKTKIVKGDTVMIRRGKEKGKRGTVKAVFPKSGLATVEGLNVVKREVRYPGPDQIQDRSPGQAARLRPLRRARARNREGTLDMATTVSRLREKYTSEVRKTLIDKFGYSNVHQVPKLDKVVLNMSVGDAIVNSKILDVAAKELETISGQKPVITKAKKSIAAFKLREGMNIGAKVTLRGDRMYIFLDKLFNIVLPRIRDFRGLPRKSFDGRGNYNLGLKEQTVFPEINYDKVDKLRGMDIVIVTTAKTDEEASEFLKAMGLPLQKDRT